MIAMEIPHDISMVLEVIRFPLETVGIILLLSIRSRLDNHRARIAVLEKNLGINYPEEFKQ